MGLLGDVYSYGDGLKRKLKQLLQDPAGYVSLGATRFAEDNQARNNLFENAYPMAGSKTVLNTPEQIAGFRKQAADEAANMAMQAATVWHGSPHKFNKFDSSKIGTGEGAQAYGHGLYLAESPDVAKSYQTVLAADRGFSFGGKSGLTRAQVQDMVNARYGGGYLDGVLRPSGVADSFIDDMVTGLNRAEGAYPRQYKPGSQRAKLYDELRGQITHADPGSLYKVDLPDDAIAKMLDWDKPLSQQAPEVQSAMTSKPATYSGPEYTADELINAILDGRQLPSRQTATPEQISPLSQALGMFREKNMSTKPPTGEQVYRALADQYGHDKAAKMMRDAGIPGIRYLDGGSRGAGQGSSNYVIFPGNESLLKILERNGQPIDDILTDTAATPALFKSSLD